MRGEESRSKSTESGVLGGYDEIGVSSGCEVGDYRWHEVNDREAKRRVHERRMRRGDGRE